VEIVDSELVGLAPAESLLPAAAQALALRELAPRRVLELAWGWPAGAWPDSLALDAPRPSARGTRAARLNRSRVQPT
jgi:hypothetical protein